MIFPFVPLYHLSKPFMVHSHSQSRSSRPMSIHEVICTNHLWYMCKSYRATCSILGIRLWFVVGFSIALAHVSVIFTHYRRTHRIPHNHTRDITPQMSICLPLYHFEARCCPKVVTNCPTQISQPPSPPNRFLSINSVLSSNLSSSFPDMRCHNVSSISWR